MYITFYVHPSTLLQKQVDIIDCYGLLSNELPGVKDW